MVQWVPPCGVEVGVHGLPLPLSPCGVEVVGFIRFPSLWCEGGGPLPSVVWIWWGLLGSHSPPPCDVEVVWFIELPLTPLGCGGGGVHSAPFPPLCGVEVGFSGFSLPLFLWCGGSGVHRISSSFCDVEVVRFTGSPFSSPLVWRWWGSLGSISQARHEVPRATKTHTPSRCGLVGVCGWMVGLS